jgi:hypothetical protein
MYASIVKDKDGKEVTDAHSVEAAKKFNSVQRGHANCLENHYAIQVLALIPSLFFPKLSATGLALWTFGATVYAKQYASGGAEDRNKGIALTKYVGLLLLLGLNIATSYTIYTA